MTDPSATISSSKPSKRQAKVLELGDTNPKPSKWPKIIAIAPINEPEEVCAKAKHICSSQRDYITSRAMSHDKEIVGKDKDSANESPYGRSSTACVPATLAVTPKNWSEILRLVRIGFGNLALSHYNEQNSTKYELLEDETFDSSFFVESSGRFIDCLFYAVDSYTKQFSAKVTFPYPSEPTVTNCMIIEENKRYIPMTDPPATSSSEPSMRYAEVLELGDPNPKPSKRPKTLAVAPIHEPEEICGKAKHICSSQHDYIILLQVLCHMIRKLLEKTKTLPAKV